MSFDVDEKEFHETFDEMLNTQAFGLTGAKRWAWSALESAQAEKNADRAELEQLRAVHTRALRLQALVWSAYAWLRLWPRRMKYKYFPKHRIKRVFKNGDSKTSVPLAPGMWPEKLTWGGKGGPAKHHEDGRRGVIVVGGKEMPEMPREEPKT